jgi:signal-induced proliferation-associated 1 like protein 1
MTWSNCNSTSQLLRKRHIGNDIVTIVFQEPGALPFTPKNIRSQFQHVFIIVQALSPCSDNTHYKVSVTRSRDVPIFGPPLPENATFTRSKDFADFMISKVINAENAAHRSEKFVTMATRTRQEYLKDLVANHSTTTAIETSQKFCKSRSHSKRESVSLNYCFLCSHALVQQQKEGSLELLPEEIRG